MKRDPARTLSYVLFAVAFGTNVPTPLLLVYRSLLDLPATTLTAIFGVYAIGLLPALLVAGPASDRLGRRPVTLPFVVLSAAASLVFIPAANSVLLLFVGRFLQGVVSGVVFSVGSAWLAELSDTPADAARRAGLALSVGWALGPLTSGLVAEFTGIAGGMEGGFGATVAPYLIHLAIMAPALLMMRSVAETLQRGTAKRPLFNLGVPTAARTAFAWFVAPAAVYVFVYPSVSITILPLLLERQLGGSGVAITAVVAGLTLMTGALVQRRAAGLQPGDAMLSGLGSGLVGFVLALVAASIGSWPLLLPVAILIGAGYGFTLAGGLAATEILAAPSERGALTATFYACAYIGFGAPLLMSVLASGPVDGAGSLFRPLVMLTVATFAIAVGLVVGPGRDALRLRTQEHV